MQSPKQSGSPLVLSIYQGGMGALTAPLLILKLQEFLR